MEVQHILETKDGELVGETKHRLDLSVYTDDGLVLQAITVVARHRAEVSGRPFIAIAETDDSFPTGTLIFKGGEPGSEMLVKARCVFTFNGKRVRQRTFTIVVYPIQKQTPALSLVSA